VASKSYDEIIRGKESYGFGLGSDVCLFFNLNKEIRYLKRQNEVPLVW
jgi:hypothetical protein